MLYLGESKNEELDVVDRGLVTNVPVVGRLGQIVVVPRQARREHRLRHVRAPDRQQAIAPKEGE